MSDGSDGALNDVDSQLHLELLVPETTLGLLDDRDVPLDELRQLALEIAEVSLVLRNQVSIIGLVCKWSLTPLLVLLNLLEDLGSGLNLEIFANAEPGDIDHGCGVHLLKESIVVCDSMLEISLKALRIDDIFEVLEKVLKMIHICLQVIVILLKCH